MSRNRFRSHLIADDLSSSVPVIFTCVRLANHIAYYIKIIQSNYMLQRTPVIDDNV